jgi:hypothetical protein
MALKGSRIILWMQGLNHPIRSPNFCICRKASRYHTIAGYPVGLFKTCKMTTGFQETNLSAAWKVLLDRTVPVRRLTRVVPRLDDQSLPFLKMLMILQIYHIWRISRSTDQVPQSLSFRGSQNEAYPDRQTSKTWTDHLNCVWQWLLMIKITKFSSSYDFHTFTGSILKLA